MLIENVLLYARIQKIELIDFRNIHYGVVEFPNSDLNSFINEEPSILGLYGQNGSGKSSVIMALAILKNMLAGLPLKSKFLSCIKDGCDRCTLKYDIILYSKEFNTDGSVADNQERNLCYNAYYSFDIIKTTEEYFDEKNNDTKEKDVLHVVNEKLQYRITNRLGDIKFSKQVFIDTSVFSTNNIGKLFGNKYKTDFYTGYDLENKRKLLELHTLSYEHSHSFIFSDRVMDLIVNTSNRIIKYTLDSESIKNTADKMTDSIKEDDDLTKKVKSRLEKAFKEKDTFARTTAFGLGSVLAMYINLNTFGSGYLHIIDTTATGITNVNTTLPLYLWENGLKIMVPIHMNKPTVVPESMYSDIITQINSISDVLGKIVPGLKLGIVDLKTNLGENGIVEHRFEIVSERETGIIPLKYESDGIRRVISILRLLIAAYNDNSFTVAIDEIDSGIFEYLLGEIISIMGESSKGQLIFTSHNLRPLEVLPPKFLCFTTTNESNRFTSISKRGNNNLRDKYFKNIVLGSDKEPIYKHTDKHDIELSLYKAGQGGGKQ